VFVVYPASHLGDRLAPFQYPAGRAGTDGPSAVVDVARLGDSAEVGGAESVSTITTVSAGSTVLVKTVVYSGPAGIYVLEGSDPAAVVKSLTMLGPQTLVTLPVRLLNDSALE
jgi:hypothetical protein